MGEFDGYLWAAYSNYLACRSPDEGATWEKIPYWGSGSIEQFDRIEAWLAFEGNLYVAGRDGFGRWREHDLKWDNLSHGLPDEPALSSLAVHRNRIFAGSWRHGVFMFDHHYETWHLVGLSDRSIPKGGLVSHRGNLYAAAGTVGHDGIYRANLQFVTPENKAAVTWGAIKLGTMTKCTYQNIGAPTVNPPILWRLEHASANRHSIFRSSISRPTTAIPAHFVLQIESDRSIVRDIYPRIVLTVHRTMSRTTAGRRFEFRTDIIRTHNSRSAPVPRTCAHTD